MLRLHIGTWRCHRKRTALSAERVDSSSDVGDVDHTIGCVRGDVDSGFAWGGWSTSELVDRGHDVGRESYHAIRRWPLSVAEGADRVSLFAGVDGQWRREIELG